MTYLLSLVQAPSLFHLIQTSKTIDRESKKRGGGRGACNFYVWSHPSVRHVPPNCIFMSQQKTDFYMQSIN